MFPAIAHNSARLKKQSSQLSARLSAIPKEGILGSAGRTGSVARTENTAICGDFQERTTKPLSHGRRSCCQRRERLVEVRDRHDAQAVRVAPRLGGVCVGDEEQVGPGLSGADRLLLDARRSGPPFPSSGIAPVATTVFPWSRSSPELVHDVEREGKACRRAADVRPPRSSRQRAARRPRSARSERRKTARSGSSGVASVSTVTSFLVSPRSTTSSHVLAGLDLQHRVLRGPSTCGSGSRSPRTITSPISSSPSAG